MGMNLATTAQGQLQGVGRGDYAVFRGIPYAKPPVGELRWKPPLPPEPWAGVRPAGVFGSRCIQDYQEPGSFYHREFFSDTSWVPPTSEDSLYLNIWTPAEQAGEGLPVAFWIHGGAFLGGYGSEPEFDGEAFCKRGVVLVTINYRLGALGFLAHPWLSGENRGLSGNYGILDQIAALDWVGENIGGFGGDPEKITVFGQSAGCMSVQTLVSSPLTRGRIAGAILQSAGGYRTGINRDKPLEEAEADGEEFVALSGAQSPEELRTLSPERILGVTREFQRVRGERGLERLPFTPLIDGHVLECGYNEAVERGAVHSIPYLIGSTSRDLGVTKEQLDRGEKSRLYQGCVDWSLQNERTGIGPSYVYYFTQEPLGDDAGAFHSAELWYLFGTLDRSWRPKEERDYRLSQTMADYWCNFVRSGDPNGEGAEEWRPCTEADTYVNILD